MNRSRQATRNSLSISCVPDAHDSPGVRHSFAVLLLLISAGCGDPSHTTSHAPKTTGHAVPETSDASNAKTWASRDKVRNKVVEIVAKHFGIEPAKVWDESRFVEDLNADSLDTVELVMEFEDEFKITLADEDAARLKSVGQAVDHLWAQVASR